MKTAGVTQEALAEKMGVTQGAIAHWLKGRREINLTVFFELCQKAGADPQRILFAQPSVPELAALKQFVSENPWLREMSERAINLDDAMSETLPPRLLKRLEQKDARPRKGKSLKNTT